MLNWQGDAHCLKYKKAEGWTNKTVNLFNLSKGARSIEIRGLINA